LFITRGVKSGEVREAEHSSDPQSGSIFGIRGKSADLPCGRYIVGTSTNNPNINSYCLIAFPLTPKHVTLNDLESPFCLKFGFVPVCLEL